MCRIAIIFDGGKNKPQIKVWWKSLETTGGGQGNGFAFAEADHVEIIKSLLLTTDDIVDMLPDEKTILFHTRKVSTGGMTDELCHPFRINNELALVHNGTWKEYLMVRTILLNRNYTCSQLLQSSDTQIVAYLIKEYGIDILDMVNEGVWVTLGKDGDVILYYYSGQFEFAQFPDGTWAYGTTTGILHPETTYKPVVQSVIRLSEAGPEILRGSYVKVIPTVYSTQKPTQLPSIEDMTPVYKCDFCRKNTIRLSTITNILNPTQTKSVCEKCLTKVSTKKWKKASSYCYHCCQSTESSKLSEVAYISKATTYRENQDGWGNKIGSNENKPLKVLLCSTCLHKLDMCHTCNAFYEPTEGCLCNTDKRPLEKRYSGLMGNTGRRLLH